MAPSSPEDIVLKDLIVLCPINSTTEVQSLSIQSMEPTDTTTQTSTQYAGYLYTSVNALGGLTTCTGTESAVAAGEQLQIAVITYLGYLRSIHAVSDCIDHKKHPQQQYAYSLHSDALLQAVLLLCLVTAAALWFTRAMAPCWFLLGAIMRALIFQQQPRCVCAPDIIADLGERLMCRPGKPDVPAHFQRITGSA